MNSKMALVGAAAMTVGFSVQARELIWTGAASQYWNHTDLNWYVVGDESKTPVTFKDSDDVIFNDESTTDWLILDNSSGQNKPYGVTFDISRTLVFTNEAESTIVGWNTKYLTKKGTGRLIISDYDVASGGYRLFTTYGSGITIEAGTLEFARRYHLRYYANDARDIVTVKNGATLVFDRVAIFEGENVNVDPSKNLPFSKTHISIDKGGKLILNDIYGSFGMWGPLTLNDASDFDFSNTKGYSNNSSSWGLLMFAGKVTLNGSGNPYVWDSANTLKADTTAINLCCSNTEFCVADVTGTPAEDFTLKMQLRDHFTGSATLPGGLIKSGPGTMALTKADNVFTGDILVNEGVLQYGPNDQAHGNESWTFFGNPNVPGRTITAKEGAALYFPDRNCFGTQRGITNLCSNYAFTFVFDGGTYTNAAGQGFLLPNLEFRNGGTVSPGSGAGGYGRFMVKEYFRVTGSKPFVWNLSAPTAAAAGGEALSLNGYPRNIFEIEDVTGDAEPDATFHVPFIIANGYFRSDVPVTGNHLLSDWAFGFTKRGPGTMRYAAAKYYSKTTGNPSGYSWSPYNGNTDVEEGTLQMDGDISFSDTVNVSAGAYLSGTGTVNNVVLAAGAGLKVPARQEKPLAVNGDFTLGANPVVDINLPAGATVEDVKAKILTVTGTIAGAENLKNATVRVNGEPTDKIRLTCSGNTLKCGFAKGLMLMVR